MSRKHLYPSLFIFIFLIGSIFATLLYLNKIGDSTSTSADTSSGGLTETVKIKTPKEITEEIIRKKIEKVQKRNALRGLVVEGDIYYQNNELALALKSYLEVFRKNKKDTAIIEKIGDTYAAMKRFQNAHTYYRELPLIEKNRDTIIKNLLSSINITNSLEREKFLTDIKTLGLSEEENFYYTTSLSCLDDFHTCKTVFGEYFTQKVEIEKDVLGLRALKYTPLIALRTAIQNYENFQLDQVYYKDALIIGSFFQQDIYSIAIVLGERLIQQKSDYKAILKIIAEGYFEIGNYEKAKQALTNYYKIDTSDPTILYMLGIIYSEEKDFILSNIYFTKSIEGGFSPTLNARRNIVYNYFLLENNDSFLTSLQNLIEKEASIGQSDLRLAVYYHILYGDVITAKRYIKKGKVLFPGDAYFYGYAGLLDREEKNYTTSRSELETGYQKDPKNPFILLNFGILEKELGNESKAKLYFKKILEQNSFGEFALQAKQELSEIESIINPLKNIFD